MVDVAAAAKISRNTLYRRFGTKDALLVALNGYLTSQFADGLQHAVEREPAPEDRARVVATATIELVRKYHVGALIELEPEWVRRTAKMQFQEWVSALTALLAWPDQSPAGARGAALRRAAEVLYRYALSLELIEPASWAHEVEIVSEIVQRFLADLPPADAGDPTDGVDVRSNPAATGAARVAGIADSFEPVMPAGPQLERHVGLP